MHDIELLGSAVRRGRELELLVANLFRQLHFEVRINPGTARPRQTDVLASKAGEVYLIECKWRSDKANVDDIDSLRSRLRRTDGGVVGILVSFNGFTGSVLFDVEHHREQPVLLISGEELQRAAGRMETLSDLLWRKKDALLTDGRVMLDEPVTKPVKSKRPIITLPDANSSFLTSAGLPSSVIECGGSFSGMLFARKLADIDWVHATGHGVTLDVTPSVRDERELLGLVAKLANLGWATSDASWSIQQTTRNWHGMGSAAFAEQLPRWKHRAGSPESHHSEQICYFDRCDGGFYTLTAGIAANPSRWTLAPVLSFQLQGIPLDTGPLLQLCRSVGIHEGLYFRPRAEPSVRRYRDGKPLANDVTPIHLVTSPKSNPELTFDHWVTGIVIANPFHIANGHDGPSFPPEIPSQVCGSEHLICALAHHHPLDGRELSYDLVRIEDTSTSDALVIRPVADWLDLNPPSSGDSQPNQM
ncbi:restriction endonuclease [Kribbella qitaiheensis]|uniref:restriction endonuclease n=1 Tax=Kribbella qitaiheensis TaxID=1544730 RepID=UPI0036186ABB